MADHDAFNSVINQPPVYFSEGGIPFLGTHIVAAHDQMLIPFLCSIAWKMLCGAGNRESGIPDTPDIGSCHPQHFIRIRPIGPGIHNGVAPVQIQVADRVEQPVDADASRLPGAGQADMIGGIIISAGACLGCCGYIGSVRNTFSAAGVAVSGNQHGNSAVLLIQPILSPGFSGILPLPAKSAGAAIFSFLANTVLVHSGQVSHQHKQLTNLFLRSHAVQRIINPFYLTVIQKKRFCL